VTKRSRKQAKDNGEKATAAKPVAEAIIAKVATDVAEIHEQGKRVKELRDKGMAWWAIAHEMGLPGSASNVKEGKSGAARARALYRKTFGELPGDVVKRSTKATRANDPTTAVVRKPVFDPQLLAAEFDNDGALAEANAEILDIVDNAGGSRARELRWVGRVQCSDGSTIETERSALVKPGSAVIRRELGRTATLSFQAVESHGDHRSTGSREIRLADVYDVRK
jgi:hypothetical protein